MPDERREFHKIRPASHTLLSVNCLYQINAAERKGGVYEIGSDERQVCGSCEKGLSTTAILLWLEVEFVCEVVEHAVVLSIWLQPP